MHLSPVKTFGLFKWFIVIASSIITIWARRSSGGETVHRREITQSDGHFARPQVANPYRMSVALHRAYPKFV